MDDRQPWVKNPDEHCWCDPCIRDREEERKEVIDYQRRLADYYQTAADNYRDMFGRTDEWQRMEKQALAAESTLIDLLERS